MMVNLNFLKPGRTYAAQLYRDGVDADYRTNKRHSIVIEARRVTNAGAMTLRPDEGIIAAFGVYAARHRAA